MRRNSLVRDIATYTLFAILFIIFVFPLYWMIITSCKIQLDTFHYQPVYIRTRITDFNYRVGLLDLWGLQGIRDSFIISSANTLLVLAFSIPTAYAIARMPMKGKKALMNWILSQRMLPPIAVAIPFFLIWRSLGWLDTYQALIFTYMIFNLPFAIWMLAGYIEEIPKEIDEAALIDGASRLKIIKDIILPLLKPSLIVTTLFTFIFSWNEFLIAVVLTRDQVKPFTVVIPGLIYGHNILWGAISAVTLVGLIPEIIIALMLQKHIVRGLTLGAIRA